MMLLGRRHASALTDDLARWVTEGLLSDDQAAAIVVHERSSAQAVPTGHRPASTAHPRRIPAFAEALGYIGGVLAIVGLTLLVSHYWPDLATSLRLALSLVMTAALIGGGGLVDEHADPAFARLRWFLWTIAAGTSAVFTAVLMTDVVDVEDRRYAVAACFGTVAFVSGLLWWGRDRPVQQFLCFGAGVASVGVLMTALTNSSVGGLAVWLLAVAYLGMGIRRITPYPTIPLSVGAAAAVIGGFMTATEWAGPGLLFGLATVGGLLLLAALPHVTLDAFERVVLLFVAGIGALQGLPFTLGHFAEHAGGVTGLITWAAGAVILTIGASELLRAPIIAQLVGGAGMIGGAALTGVEWEGFAPLFGIATAVCLIVLGMMPGRVLFSLLGSFGLLINVPWAIGRYFPGEGRAPLLILVSGALILVVAVLLARQGDRFRTELGRREAGRSPTMPPLEGERTDPRQRGDDAVRRSSNG